MGDVWALLGLVVGIVVMFLVGYLAGQRDERNRWRSGRVRGRR